MTFAEDQGLLMIFLGKHIASFSSVGSILNEWCYKHTPVWNSSKLWGILAKHCIFFCECCRNVWTPYLRTWFFLLISLMLWFFSVLIFYLFWYFVCFDSLSVCFDSLSVFCLCKYFSLFFIFSYLCCSMWELPCCGKCQLFVCFDITKVTAGVS